MDTVGIICSIIAAFAGIITGKTPRTAFIENYGGNIPFLSPSDNMDIKYVGDTNKTLSEQGVREVKNCLLPEGAVCVSCIGSDLGKVLITTQPIVTNQQINSIIVNDENDVDFVYYLMAIVGKRLNIISKTSTAVPIINKSSFSNHKITLPNIETQKKIADILSSLDEKIEINRKINARLEELAQALFKSWFIDFEPFGGKMPEDWEEINLKDFVKLECGFPFKSAAYSDSGKYEVVTIKAVQDGFLDLQSANKINDIPEKMPSYCFLQHGDILISLTGNVGRVCIVNRENLLLNQRVAKLSSKTKQDTPFSYFLFRQESFKKSLITLANGTAQLNLSPLAIGDIRLNIPTRDVLNQFANATSSILDKKVQLEQESAQLAKLRDTLLPKLMSGELIPE